MMLYRVFLLCASMVLLAACSATGPNFSALEVNNSDKASIYIYRPWAMLDGAAAPTIQVDGIDRFDLSNGGYEVIHVDPGVHQIVVKAGGYMSNWRAGEMGIEFPFEGNRNYFLRLTAEVLDGGIYGNLISISGSYRFGLVAEEVAILELSETKKN